MDRLLARVLSVFIPVTVLGFAAVGAATWKLSESTTSWQHIAGVSALLVAAIVAEAFPVPIENLPAGGVSLATIFIVGAAVIYGWPEAVIVGLLTRAVLEIAERRPPVKQLYNSALYALSAAAAGLATVLFVEYDSVAMLLLEVMLASVAFYAVNIPLVVGVMALASRQPFWPLLRRSVAGTATTYATMASVTVALTVLWEASPLYAAALVGPLIAVAQHQRSSHRALHAMRLALTDPLTGLGNHRYFQEQLELHLAEAAEADAPLSVCLFDLDNFKQINDRHGHPAGDKVLAQVAVRLRNAGEAFRLGGDEFALILPACGEVDALEQAERVVDALGADTTEHGGTVSFSAGVATFPQHGAERSELVRVADIALYWAKAEGKNRVRPYEADPPVAEHLEELATGTHQGTRLEAAVALAAAVDARDAYVGRHSERVGDLAASCAARLGMTAGEVGLVRLAGRLHDLGKIAVPKEILLKRGPLTVRERQVLERHPQIGFGMLEPLGIEPVATWVLHHHERWDGHGYPANLAAEQIPIGARIVLVADAYDAMLSDRGYRPMMTADAALDELARCAGTQFDPTVVAAFVEGLASDWHAEAPAALTAV